MSSSWSNPRALAFLFLVGCGFSSHGETQGPIDAPSAPPIDSPTVTPDGHPADWWDASWSHRRLITIDTKQLDGKLTGYPLTGFPVLVKLTPATIDYSAVKSDGSDLRFVLPGQTTPLSYDLDTFASGGTSFVWVRMPSLMPPTMQQLFVYHGNPSANAVTSGADVFADSHVSVHHLGADYNDVTGQAHTGTVTGNPMAIADSPLGGARRFNGTSDYVTLAGPISYNFMFTLTVSAWIRVTAFEFVYQAIVTKGDSSWRLHRDNNTDHIGFGTTSGGPGNNDNEAGSVNIADHQWHHAAIVYDGKNKVIYVDGAQDITESYKLQLDQNTESVAIGRNSTSTLDGQRFWHGDIDEVRISSIARTPAWIGAEYVTATNAGFVTLGPDQRY